MMAERAEIFQTFDRQELFFRCFTPKHRSAKDAKIPGLVLCVHGFAEHSGRYHALAEHVCGLGLAFACFDLRGHGLSGPNRGDAVSLEQMILDIVFMQTHLADSLGLNLNEKARIGLMGHSFGGLLVTYAAAILGSHCPPLFLSSPCFKVKQHVPQWQKTAADWLPKVAPKMMLPLDLIPENICNNPATVEQYKKDPMILTSVSARLGKIFLDAVDPLKIENALSMIVAPTTVVASGGDRLVDAAYTEQVLQKFPSKTRTQVFIDGAGHEAFNEVQEHSSLFYQHFDQWLESW